MGTPLSHNEPPSWWTESALYNAAYCVQREEALRVGNKLPIVVSERTKIKATFYRP